MTTKQTVLCQFFETLRGENVNGKVAVRAWYFGYSDKWGMPDVKIMAGVRLREQEEFVVYDGEEYQYWHVGKGGSFVITGKMFEHLSKELRVSMKKVFRYNRRGVRYHLKKFSGF